MENEQKGSKQSSGQIGYYLKDITAMQPNKDCKIQGLNLRFKNSSGTGLVPMQSNQQKKIGSEPGRLGLIALPNGAEITAVIETARGANLIPSLTSQQKSSLNAIVSLHESMTYQYSDPDDYELPKIRPHDLEMWGKSYIQGMAALEPAPIKSIDVLIGVLRVKRPMQKMNTKDMEMFLKLTAKFLHESGFGYFAVEQGIKDLMMKDDGAFFPTDKKLQQYIYPVNYKFKQKMNLLGKILEQS